VSARLDDKQSKQFAKLEKKVARYNKHVESRHEQWESNFAALQDEENYFKNFQGEADSGGILLKADEILFGDFPCGLVGERPGETKYVGSHSGFSVPIGSLGGRSIRYNFGSSRGHVVRSAPVEAIVDNGRLLITNQRITFVGAKQSRDNELKKVVGLTHPFRNRLSISSSNRQSITTLNYSASIAESVNRAVLLATAVFQGTRKELCDSITSEIKAQITLEPKKLEQPSAEDFLAGKISLPDDIKGGEFLGSLPRFIDRVTSLWIGIASLLLYIIPVVGIAICGLGIYKGVISRRSGQKTKANLWGIVLSTLALPAALTATYVFVLTILGIPVPKG